MKRLLSFAALPLLASLASAQEDSISAAYKIALTARAHVAAQAAAAKAAPRPLPTPGTIDAERQALTAHDWEFKLPGHVLPGGGRLDDGDRFIYTFNADGTFVARHITDYPIAPRKGTWTLASEPQLVNGQSIGVTARLALKPADAAAGCGWMPCASQGAVYVAYNAFEDSLLFWGGNIAGSVKFFRSK